MAEQHEDAVQRAEQIWRDGTDEQRSELVQQTCELVEKLAPQLDTLADIAGSLALVLRVAGLREMVVRKFVADATGGRAEQKHVPSVSISPLLKETGTRVEVTAQSSPFYKERGTVVRFDAGDVVMVALDSRQNVALHGYEIRVLTEEELQDEKDED